MNRNIIKKMILSFVVLSLITTQVSYATIITNISVDFSNGVVIVNGQSGQNKILPFEVVKTNKAISPVLPYFEGNETENFSSIGEIKTDADGKFEQTFTIDNTLGKFLLRINEDGQIIEKNINYIPINIIQTSITSINNAVNAEQAETAINALLTIIETPYYYLNATNSFVNSYVYKHRPYNSSIPDDIVEKIKDAITILAIGETNTANDVGKIIVTYSLINKIIERSRAKVIFNDESIVKNKDDVFARLIAFKCENIDDLITKFEDATILSAIDNITSWGSLEDLLKNSYNIIGISDANWNRYLGLTNRSKVLIKMAGKSYMNVDEINNDFISLVNSVNLDEDTGGGTGSIGGGGGRTSFIAPIINTNILPKDNQPKVTFDDLEGVPWAVESIEELADVGIVQGFGNGIFAPNQTVKREEFIKMLVVAFDLKSNNNEINFTDANMDSWYYNYIENAVSNKIVNGISDKYFGVGQEIIRQDMAVMLYRTSMIKNIVLKSSGNNFNDINEISDYAVVAIENMFSSGILSGVGDNRFAPMEYVTRAQAAKAINLLLKLSGR